MPRQPRPSPEELRAAVDRTVPDVIAPSLEVLFCGINPGLYSALVGHHFARPGNRFWKALHAAGFTDRLLTPSEDWQLIGYGCGITNLVGRATAAAADLASAELTAGRERLEEKVATYAPAWVAVLGLGAFRTAFGHPRAVVGVQPEPLGTAGLWVLPNPSGLNANYRPADLARLFGELRAVARREG